MSAAGEVVFRRAFYVVTGVLGALLFLLGTAVFGSVEVGFLVVAAWIVGTSNGMVWGARRVVRATGCAEACSEMHTFSWPCEQSS